MAREAGFFLLILAFTIGKSAAKTVSNNVDNSALIAEKLGEIVDALQFSNQKNFDFSNLQTNLFSMLSEQETRFRSLESRIDAECRHKKTEDYQELALQLHNLETRLNMTIQENIDLRATLDIMQTENVFTEETNSTSRQPRNFLALTTSKGHGVAFDAYRNQPFSLEQSIVTYDGTLTNLGNGLNISTGMFTAPKGGIYAFNFHALTRDGSATYVKIVHNGRNVGGAYRRHEEGQDQLSASKRDGGVKRAEGMLAQSVVLQVEKDDQVGVFAYHGNIRDGGWHYTHFTGYLLF